MALGTVERLDAAVLHNLRCVKPKCQDSSERNWFLLGFEVETSLASTHDDSYNYSTCLSSFLTRLYPRPTSR